MYNSLSRFISGVNADAIDFSPIYWIIKYMLSVLFSGFAAKLIT